MLERHGTGAQEDCLFDIGIHRPDVCDDADQGGGEAHVQPEEGKREVKESGRILFLSHVLARSVISLRSLVQGMQTHPIVVMDW